MYGFGQKRSVPGDSKKEVFKLLVPKASLPPNTVPGQRTVVVPIQKSHRPLDYLKYAMTKYFQAEEPVVVLLTESKFVDKAKEILDEVGPVVAYKASGKEAINEKKYKEL